MGMNVEQLAAARGRTVEEVLAACRTANVLAWSGFTPLDETEGAAIDQVLHGARSVAPPPPFVAPGGPPPPPSTTPGQPGWGPPPPPSGAMPPPVGYAVPPGYVPPPPARPSSGFGRAGRILAGVLAFLAFAGVR